jgi:hypothetical protein
MTDARLPISFGMNARQRGNRICFRPGNFASVTA